MRGRVAAGLLLLAACGHVNLAHRDALAQARAAHLRGDLDGEALALRAACMADRDDRDACTGAVQVGEAALVRDVGQARTACLANDVGRCLASLRGARQLAPADPRVTGMLSWAGTIHANQCVHGREASISDAVVILRCLESQPDLGGAPGYPARVLLETRRAAVVLVDLAETVHDNLGASLAAWSAAACLDPARARPAEAARQAFVDAQAVPLEILVSHLGGGDARPAELMCRALVAGLGPRVRCGAPAGGPPILRVSIGVQLGQIEHSVTEEPANLHYQDGTRVTDNPAHATAEDEVARAEHALHEVEERLADCQARCDAAESALSRANQCSDCSERTQRDADCGEVQSERDLESSRRSELDSARSTLASTPATLEEPIWRDYTYVIRNHVWSSRYQATLSRYGDGRRDAEDAGEIRYQDSEHDGFPAGGLGADPLTPPDPSYFSGELTRRLTEAASALAGRELAERAAVRRRECGDGPPRWDAAWLGCWAESSLWAGELVDGLRLLQREALPAAGLPTPACVGR